MAFRFLDGKLFARMFRGGAAFLRSKADKVNELNVFPVPDGDTGDNMSMTMEGGVNAVDTSGEKDAASLGEVSEQVAHGMLLGARGNSGVILSQLFAGMANVFDGCDEADVNTVGEALKQGVKRAYSAVVTPTEGTILTVAREAVDYACSRITKDSTIESLFDDLSFEMNNSLKRTPELLSVLKEAGVIDSGGAGLVYIMEGFKKVLGGIGPEEIGDTDAGHGAKSRPSVKTVDLSAFTEDSELEFGYCTELLIRLQNKKTNPQSFDTIILTDFLRTVGDSIVCFKQDSAVKVHVHTFTPEKVLAFCRQFGEFLTVKIENMSVQHSESAIEEGHVRMQKSRRKYAVVAVASGDGIAKLFTELGADRVIRGGQTMNPSAEDFINAFDEVNADCIFVLPNNGNIILSAKQAAGIYGKSKVYVLESHSLGDGYAALTALNYESSDAEGIAAMLTEAMENVVTCMITTAVRDTNLNSVEVHKGDYIGILGKTMLTAKEDRLSACKESLSGLSLEDKFALTVFTGSGASATDTEKIEEYVGEEYPGVELYTVDGGQDVYDYIFVAE
ncbi:MAG: DAK2 domain-containing protein [Clostridia bacterium]|nr:DAK2 domain-containing protein [Clostridia bacterium]